MKRCTNYFRCDENWDAYQQCTRDKGHDGDCDTIGAQEIPFNRGYRSGLPHDYGACGGNADM